MSTITEQSSWPKPCAQCVHALHPTPLIGYLACARTGWSIDYERGESKGKHDSFYVQAPIGGRCGPEGKFFEQKAEKLPPREQE